jgi:transposase
MITQEVWMDVRLMYRQGASIREIARRTGLSRVTVRRVLSQRAPKAYGPRPPRPGKLDPFAQQLEAAVQARPWARASVLYRELAAQGFAGHYETVKRFVRRLRRAEQARRRACVRFETGPGVEAQFDWKGPLRGLLQDRPQQEVWFFRYVLAWCRRRWTWAVTAITLPADLAILRRAFEAVGGLAQRVVFDNFKAAVLRPRPHLVFHPLFLDFCRHYGVEPAPALPRSPERKGKVERGFLDLVTEELLERSYRDLAELQAALCRDDEAYAERIHCTTGARPAERFAREQEYLLALPGVAFDPRLPETRRVLSDCTISYHAAYYSVPHTLVGGKVTVKADPWGDSLEIYAGAEPVAAHRLVGKRERSICEEHVAPLRRPRWERVAQRRRPRPTPAPETPELLSIVPWPRFADVPLRPIEVYAALAGGGQ